MKYTIYKITNQCNGKGYIGFTSKALETRWSRHRQNARSGRPEILYNAMRKYGEDKFTIEIVEEFDDLHLARDSMEERYIREHCTHFLDGHGYNMTYGGEGTQGHRHSKETIREMCLNRKGARHSEATKQKISERKKGRKNPNFDKVWTPEARMRFSDAKRDWHNSRPNTHRVLFPDGTTVDINNRAKFCDEQGLNYSSVCAAIYGGRPYKGYVFTPIPPEEELNG